MYWLNRDFSSQERRGHFPYRVSGLFYCRNYVVNGVTVRTAPNIFEVSIRTQGGTQCLDNLDGRCLHLPFPNVVIKRPGHTFTLHSAAPREAFAFLYPSPLLREFERLGFLPDCDAWHFEMTDSLQRLIGEFHQCLNHLCMAGVADEMDWLCFKLFREIGYAKQHPNEKSQEGVIPHIALWLQLHYNEKFNLEELAERHSLSRATFFRLWSRTFSQSPTQYLRELRLTAAANLLATTTLPVYKIITDVGFGGAEPFFSHFRQRYGMSPAQWRKTQIEQSNMNP